MSAAPATRLLHALAYKLLDARVTLSDERDPTQVAGHEAEAPDDDR